MGKCQEGVGRTSEIRIRSAGGHRKEVIWRKSWKDVGIPSFWKISAGIKNKRLSAGGSRKEVGGLKLLDGRRYAEFSERRQHIVLEWTIITSAASLSYWSYGGGYKKVLKIA